MPNPEAIFIGGRVFKSVSDSTAENDVYNRGHLNKAGLANLHMRVGETPEAFAHRILAELSTNTDVFLLLGGLLIPMEIDVFDWTPALAKQTADFLRKRTAPEDKKEIESRIASVVIGFLKAELSLSMISPRFSLVRAGQDSSLVSPANLSSVPESLTANGPGSSVN